ncbi:hypothetical protein [Paenibacillus sp. FSL R7-0331]|uniref:hypothetical protein n=1 Tax=Paenibacillus sp. FSL R7-0331 TaxID=1536773 RepID=UPI0004F7005A|nr:hypothetical protein [Paenibacillus sp. FSL R7-0331]AIQ54779.1 hypothetical protein R70331_26945 [Paenibacillus sp. FSL R7-0331]
MANYEALEDKLRNAIEAKILILDSGKLQFLYQHQDVLKQDKVFEGFDVVLIPGWVQAEYVHHTGKVEYVASIPIDVLILEEEEDYPAMISYEHQRLMEIFRLSAPHGEALRFLSLLSRKDIVEWGDDWITRFYAEGFPMKQTETRTTRKNAGEASILTLAYLLLSHYPTQIHNIAIATGDFGLINIRDNLEKHANNSKLNLNISVPVNISFLSKDVTMFQAVKRGSLQVDDIPRLRPNDSSAIYLELFEDGTSVPRKLKLETTKFVDICRHHHRYIMIY